ncbi:hypothetical protein [Bacillus infantis]|uniref:hypothetical protein n=1 Tax=Bacillus infantis TaxID=324767 RepID=UPI002155AE1E|nr:hypothetical protein [Bacillus infantis]MCR6612463.1 hypothetical protein [Bacillus infantis]
MKTGIIKQLIKISKALIMKKELVKPALRKKVAPLMIESTRIKNRTRRVRERNFFHPRCIDFFIALPHLALFRTAVCGTHRKKIIRTIPGTMKSKKPISERIAVIIPKI